MRKTKKQLLGLVCLAAVAVMTAIAISLPVPDAAAADEDQASAETGAQVQVTIFEDQQASIRIQSPRNGEVFTTNKIPVEIVYTRANRIDLTYKDIKGVEHKKTLDIAAADFEAGVIKTELELSEYLDNKELTTLTATLYGNNGTELSDFVQFSYRAMAVEMGPTNDDNKNPSVTIKANDTVDIVRIQVYNEKGDPIFVNKDGDDTPLFINWSLIDPATGEAEVILSDGTKAKGKYDAKTGELTVELPMDKANAGKGTYDVVIIGSKEDGSIISVNQLEFDYEPKAPKLPDTGSAFSNINITKADYLVTGLIAFGLAAGFALILIFRRNHRN